MLKRIGHAKLATSAFALAAVAALALSPMITQAYSPLCGMDQEQYNQDVDQLPLDQSALDYWQEVLEVDETAADYDCTGQPPNPEACAAAEKYIESDNLEVSYYAMEIQNDQENIEQDQENIDNDCTAD